MAATLEEEPGPGGSEPTDPKNSSVPLEGGGDTHFHPHGQGEGDYTTTTSVPTGEGGAVKIHDNPDGSEDIGHT